MPTCCTSQHCHCQCPWREADCCQPTPLLETPKHSQKSLAQSLVGSLLLSPGFWCTHFVCVCVCVCALQEFLFPHSCGNSVIKSCWTLNQIQWGSSVFLSDTQIVKPVAGPRTFTTVWELLWYNCSLVCELSTGQPYSDYRLTTPVFLLFLLLLFH